MPVLSMALDFMPHLFDDISSSGRTQVPFETAERHSNHIPVVQFCAEFTVAELEPQAMHQFNILRPKPWRMWPEVVIRRLPTREDYFKRE